jgi:hypothetical protein
MGAMGHGTSFYAGASEYAMRKTLNRLKKARRVRGGYAKGNINDLDPAIKLVTFFGKTESSSYILSH